jgi:hypothetical protein
MAWRLDGRNPEFPPELQRYDPADGWADGEAWWAARIEFARKHGVYGRTASGKGKILPILQEMCRQSTRNDEGLQ